MKSVLAVLLFLHSAVALQQSPADSATVAGHVTLHGKAVPGALVVVRSEPYASRVPVAQGKTDENGSYRIGNLPPGRYYIAASAPPLTSQDENTIGRQMAVDPGETREINFTLARGGVITGRVSDADDRPVVDQRVSISAAGADHPGSFHDEYQTMTTDDRGVYRVYGIPPGRYSVSVGEGGASSSRRLDYGQSYYTHTYHLDNSDGSKPGVIEITEGAEVSGVDIVVGRRAKTYEASGRIVDAETGRPQAGINWGYGGNAMSNFGRQSDENGGFKITGLMPGRYSVFAGCEGDFYGGQVEFDITDHDVTGLEIRRTRGASISGKVVVEGVSDPAVLRKLSQVSLNASSNAGSVGSSIDVDGSYYFCGLRPGRVKVSAHSWRQSGFWLLRVERNGIDLRQGIEVSPGDHVSDVRIVLGYATGIIRGQVTAPGYELPKGVRLQITARRIGDDDISNHISAETDDRGRFMIEGLTSGEYELSAGSSFVSIPGAQIPFLVPVKQIVVVTNGAESTVTLVLKVIEKSKTR